MINNTLKILNGFMTTINYLENNDFMESDFMRSTNYERNDLKQLIEAHKDKQVTYKGITFSISFFVTINELTDELYHISFNCNEVNQNNHIIVTEYLTQMMVLFIDYVGKDLFLSIDENENIVEFFQQYLEERKEGYYPLDSILASIVQGSFKISHQFHNENHYVYFYAVANGLHNIFLQLVLPVEHLNTSMNMN